MMDEITITVDQIDDCSADWSTHTPGHTTLDMLVLFTAKHEWLDGDAKPDVVETGIGAKVELYAGTPISVETQAVEHEDYPLPQWLGVNDPALRAAIMKAAPAQEEAEQERALAAHEARHG